MKHSQIINIGKMKYLQIILLFLIIFNGQLFAQKIDTIDHGKTYRSIKEMTYKEYRRKCRSYDFEIVHSTFARLRFVDVFSFYNRLESHYGYLFSSFALVGSKEFRIEISEKLQNRYVDYIRADGRKKSYEYIQLFLEKFEIISEYIKDQYNYSVEKELERKKISKKLEEISEKTENKQRELDKQKNNKIEEVYRQRDKAIKDSELSFDNKIKTLTKNKEKEIKSLPMKNYMENKRKISNKYESKISELKKQKIESFYKVRDFWEDKVIAKVKVIEKEFADKASLLEIEGVKLQNAKREEIIASKNFNKLREDIEKRYEKAILEIDAKLEEQIKKM